MTRFRVLLLLVGAGGLGYAARTASRTTSPAPVLLSAAGVTGPVFRASSLPLPVPSPPSIQEAEGLLDDILTFITTREDTDFDHMADRYREALKLKAALDRGAVRVPPVQERVFRDLCHRVRSGFLVLEATRGLDDLVSRYVLPTPLETDRTRSDLERLRKLRDDLDWLEGECQFQYSRSKKEHLLQTIQILEKQLVM